MMNQKRPSYNLNYCITINCNSHNKQFLFELYDLRLSPARWWMILYANVCVCFCRARSVYIYVSCVERDDSIKRFVCF